MTELACVTGRFQPVHDQHLELFELAMRRAEHLVVAVTNPDPSARQEEATSAHRHRPSANPFTYYERSRLLGAALAERELAARTTIVPFDLTRPAHWSDYVPLHALHFVRAYSAWERHKAELLANAGYQVELMEGDPATRLSSSHIRTNMAHDWGWEALVPDSIVPVLHAVLNGARS